MPTYLHLLPVMPDWFRHPRISKIPGQRLWAKGGLTVLLLSAAAPSLALAQSPAPQTLQTMPQPNPEADALAAAMRRLGANPRDLDALITAGELSLQLGDATAAAALFRRADLIDPMNGRVKAGMARILVQEERPGEALRYFDQALGYGLDPRTFAGDRGLAYDLIGEQERAQRDYRLALQDGSNAEVVRRYALSLGIAGKREPALEQIDTLLRKSDRGAWRARAFILAMSGDVPGANKIATSMMPAGMASGLQPFFAILPTLSPIDRAFAVHFGEVRATPQRLADARMAPALPALAVEPVAIAAAAAPVVRVPVVETARARRQSRNRAPRARQAAPAAQVAAVPVTATVTPPLPAPPILPRQTVFGARVETVQPLPRVVPVALAANIAVPPPSTRTPTPAPVTPKPPAAVAPPRMSEDSILARIIAGISIPASELGAGAVRPAVVPPVAAAPVSKPMPPKPTAAELRAAEKKALAEKKAAADRRLAAAKKAAEAKAVAEEKKAARADPARIWVQVSGGANESDLPKAWNAVKAKTPALADRQAYSTPLRATNRVVTGPFKTDAEARAFVNQLARQGVSAFPFTSTKGQKMTKIATK